MSKLFNVSLLCLTLMAGCTADTKPSSEEGNPGNPGLIPVILDTDANNELDDQHALAYLLFSNTAFEVKGVTVNATNSGGDIQQQYAEAERVMQLCGIYGKVPLFAGANADFEEIKTSIGRPEYDGKTAVDFIIQEAKKNRQQKLVLVPVGKLTNIALALEAAPDIKDKVRIVWLGSNYPEPGEYNQENDIAALNYILDQDVTFEIVTVRYGTLSGSDAVKVTPDDIEEKVAGKGPEVAPVIGRHGDSFTRFGDYSLSLFKNIGLYGDPPGRALFDLVAVAIVKNPEWGEQRTIPAPTLEAEQWKERPENQRRITIWENFNQKGILDDLFAVMQESTRNE